MGDIDKPIVVESIDEHLVGRFGIPITVNAIYLLGYAEHIGNRLADFRCLNRNGSHQCRDKPKLAEVA